MANLVQSPTEDGILELWHRRLGPFKREQFSYPSKHDKRNEPWQNFLLYILVDYEACIEGKQHGVAVLNEGEDKKPSR